MADNKSMPRATATVLRCWNWPMQAMTISWYLMRICPLSTRTSVFAKKYSERFFDCGIAECNMVGVAAGMSTFGYVPFVSSFAMFAAGRAFEQIRNSIGYPELNVKIAATHGGLSVGEDGASHQCCEDFALMRTIPGMVVICPSDDLEARAAVRAAYAPQGPRLPAFQPSGHPFPA